MYKDLYCTCTAIVLLIKPFVSRRSPCRCGLFKLFKCMSDDVWYLGKMGIFNVVGIWIKTGFYNWHNHFIFRSTGATYTYLCISNSREKVTNSGVIQLGISDHSLVFLTRKGQCYRNGPRVIETRHFKHFDKGKFVRDLSQLSWANVDLYSDPNNMWCEWKEMFLGCVDKLISMHHSN